MGDGRRPCRITLVGHPALLSDWPDGDTTVVVRHAPGTNVRPLNADRDTAGRWLVEMPGTAACLLSADGTDIRCAPADASNAWTRFLVGQALPLAAVLQGLEPFHASAVALGGRAVGFIGASHAGKTTLALALGMRGASLVTDDVLVVEPQDDVMLAHPGSSVVNARHGTTRLLAGGDPEPLGREVSRDEHGTRNEVAVQPSALPLELLYWLERSPDHDRPVFDAVPEPVLRTLLASSFNFAVQDGARLERQLDVCWRIATGVTLVRARLPAGLLPDAAAEAIECDAASRLR